MRLHTLFVKQAIQVFVREMPLTLRLRLLPECQHGVFNTSHGFLFGNAGVGYAIEMAIEQRLFVSRSEVAIMRHALVVVVRHQIEHIFLEIRSGAGDGVDFILPNHLGQRQPQLGRAHRACERHKHFSATGQLRVVGLGRLHQCGGIKVTIMSLDKLADGPIHGRQVSVGKKVSCNCCVAVSPFSASTTTEILISLVEIISILMPPCPSVSNTFAAIPE